MTTVANIRDAHVKVAIKRGDPNYVYCGRAVPSMGLTASKWANPYKITKTNDRDAVIRMYRDYLMFRPSLLASLGELRGKVLVCWCKPSGCHCDVLAELIEKMEAGK